MPPAVRGLRRGRRIAAGSLPASRLAAARTRRRAPRPTSASGTHARCCARRAVLHDQLADHVGHRHRDRDRRVAARELLHRERVRDRRRRRGAAQLLGDVHMPRRPSSPSARISAPGTPHARRAPPLSAPAARARRSRARSARTSRCSSVSSKSIAVRLRSLGDSDGGLGDRAVRIGEPPRELGLDHAVSCRTRRRSPTWPPRILPTRRRPADHVHRDRQRRRQRRRPFLPHASSFASCLPTASTRLFPRLHGRPSRGIRSDSVNSVGAAERLAEVARAGDAEQALLGRRTRRSRSAASLTADSSARPARRHSRSDLTAEPAPSGL